MLPTELSGAGIVTAGVAAAGDDIELESIGGVVEVIGT